MGTKNTIAGNNQPKSIKNLAPAALQKVLVEKFHFFLKKSLWDDLHGKMRFTCLLFETLTWWVHGCSEKILITKYVNVMHSNTSWGDKQKENVMEADNS